MTTLFGSGVVLSDGQTLYVLPSQTARYVVPSVKVTEVPGSRLGLALVDGSVLSVCRLSRKNDHFLVCELEGQLVGLAGVTVLLSGRLTDETLRATGVEPDDLNELDLGACFRAASTPEPASGVLGGLS